MKKGSPALSERQQATRLGPKQRFLAAFVAKITSRVGSCLGHSQYEELASTQKDSFLMSLTQWRSEGYHGGPCSATGSVHGRQSNKTTIWPHHVCLRQSEDKQNVRPICPPAQPHAEVTGRPGRPQQNQGQVERQCNSWYRRCADLSDSLPGTCCRCRHPCPACCCLTVASLPLASPMELPRRSRCSQDIAHAEGDNYSMPSPSPQQDPPSPLHLFDTTPDLPLSSEKRGACPAHHTVGCAKSF